MTPLTTILLEGWLLGWAVAWPPGPINLEIIRRALKRGVWTGMIVGLGACSGDFIWAMLMNSGVGILARNPAVKSVFGVASALLLVFITYSLLKKWFVEGRQSNDPQSVPANHQLDKNGFLTGLGLSFTSPWNIAFWFAMAGQMLTLEGGFKVHVLFAGSVLMGAFTWILILSTTTGLGGQWIKPKYYRHADLVAAVLMALFSIRAVRELLS